MQFYKVEAKIDHTDDSKEPVSIYDLTQKLAAQAKSFEALLRSGIYYFIAELTAKGTVILR